MTPNHPLGAARSRRLRARRGLFVLATLLMAAAGWRVPAQDPAPSGAARDSAVRASIPPASALVKASEELLSVQDKIRQVRARTQEARVSQDRRLKEILDEERFLGRALENRKGELAKRKKEALDKRAQLKKEEDGVAAIQPQTAAILGALKTALASLKRRIQGGIPWRIEQRVATADQAMQLISAPNASPSQALQTVARLYQEEEALGRLVESTAMQVDLGQDKLAVQAFHLGLLGVVFANDDGSILGYAQAGEKLEDGLNASKGNPHAAEGYLVAVDILRRRRTPSLVDLHLPGLKLREEADK